MKKILVAIVLLITVINNYGQVLMTTQSVSVNSQYTYSVTQSVSTSTVNFNITGGVAGTDYQVVTTTATSREIRWLTAAAGKTITITATEVNSTCDGGDVQIDVTVAAAVTAQFAAVSTAAECSNASGADFNTATINFSRALLASEFPVTLKVDITVDGVVTASDVDATVTNVAGGASGTLLVVGFNTNSSSANQAKQITIKNGGHDNNGGVIDAAGANITHTKTIYAVPTTDGIYVQ